MKAFFVGILFLIAVTLLAGIGFLLFPLLLVMAFFLRIVVIFLLVLLAIWLLGKFIIFLWEKMG